MLNKAVLLVACLAVAYAPAAAGIPFTIKGARQSWYRDNRPSFTPPGWVFSVAWTCLYALIGASLYISVQGCLGKSNAVWAPFAGLWVANLVLNAIWPYVFFGRQLFTLSVVTVVLMILTALGIMVLQILTLHRTTAALLLVPYVAWLGFALVLVLGFQTAWLEKGRAQSSTNELGKGK